MSGPMRREMDGMKSEMRDIKAVLRRVMITLTRLDGRIETMEANMVTKDDFSALNARMDGFSGLLLDSRQRWAVHADTLKHHDERITRVEKRA